MTLLQKEDELFVELDTALDSLSGRTASMLRMERSRTWYDKLAGSLRDYQRELVNRMHYSSRGYRETRYWLFPDTLQFRYSAMRALNPRSLFQCFGDDIDREQATIQLSSGDIHSVQEAFELGLVKDEFDNEAWYKAYLEGIPSLDNDDLETEVMSADFSYFTSDDYNEEWYSEVKDELFLNQGRLDNGGIVLRNLRDYYVDDAFEKTRDIVL